VLSIDRETLRPIGRTSRRLVRQIVWDAGNAGGRGIRAGWIVRLEGMTKAGAMVRSLRPRRAERCVATLTSTDASLIMPRVEVNFKASTRSSLDLPCSCDRRVLAAAGGGDGSLDGWHRFLGGPVAPPPGTVVRMPPPLEISGSPLSCSQAILETEWSKANREISAGKEEKQALMSKMISVQAYYRQDQREARNHGS